MGINMDPDKNIAGRSALVTGASSGIGKATAERFAAAGANVALVARSAETLESLADELQDEYGIMAVAAPTDVREEDAVKETVGMATEKFGDLDIVVVSAGVGSGAIDIADLNTEDYRFMMETNTDGAFFVTRAVLPFLRESSGNLVFVGSYAGQHPYPKNPVYGASKAWLHSFSKSVEAQVGADGVAVTLISPGGVRTSFAFGEGNAQEERYREGEAIEPEEVAEIIALSAAAGAGSTLSQADIHRRDQLTDF